MDSISAASQSPSLGVTDHPEKIVVAEQRAFGGGRLSKLVTEGVNGQGAIVDRADSVPIPWS